MLRTLDAATDPEPILRRSEAGDRQRFASFASAWDISSARFQMLPLHAKREYLLLWAGSGFLLRRRFYASARALVLVSGYSMPALWPAIGYDGPLVSSPPASRGHARRM